MRLLLASGLIFLFLWLRNAQTSSETMHGRPCESSSVSETVVSLLLSPLSVHSWLFSTLVRLLLSAPALLLSSLYYTLLFVMALPWCVSTLCLSLLLTCLRVAIFVFHLALVVGLVAILVLVRHKMADNDVAENVAKERRKELKSCNSMAGLGNLFGRRIATHG